jgi:hypothetical protein
MDHLIVTEPVMMNALASVFLSDGDVEKDEDAMLIYQVVNGLGATSCPNYMDLDGTEIWTRGRELRERKSEHFDDTHRHKPEHMSDEDLNLRLRLLYAVLYNKARIAKFIEAWKRRITWLNCPLKIDSANVISCHSIWNRWEEWEKHLDETYCSLPEATR